ncbi:protein phosphatase 1 regulatory subunit 3A-like [Chiloscyllium plagiosum]|uniref:protein phosphatase 1 regulatory subunit 3A-like n=1 Tax=Chiloscyllium plagiosum TaxID=36176 RepID=UPI001CB7D5C0|nr:protein phosphatase 1 regulatory subunit 3A-like [Chiloscyllium plagiosum]
MNSSSSLQLPNRQDQDEDEEDEEEEEEEAYGARLIPRSSPVPRKRSFSGEELGEVPPGRKVSFADARGLELARVCVFEQFPVWDEEEGDASPRPGFRLCPAFAQGLSAQQLLDRVRRHKVELESVRGATDDPLSVDCLARVLNLAYQKSVQARCTLDEWRSHYQQPAEYVPGAADGASDCFAFRLSYPCASAREGARLHFVLRYETPGGVYWANNGGANYTLVCRATGDPVGESAPSQSPGIPLRSCLKVTPHR